MEADKTIAKTRSEQITARMFRDWGWDLCETRVEGDLVPRTAERHFVGNRPKDAESEAVSRTPRNHHQRIQTSAESSDKKGYNSEAKSILERLAAIGKAERETDIDTRRLYSKFSTWTLEARCKAVVNGVTINPGTVGISHMYPNMGLSRQGQ